MASLNKVFLMGNLTRDPELRYTPQGWLLQALGLRPIGCGRLKVESRKRMCVMSILVFSGAGPRLWRVF